MDFKDYCKLFADRVAGMKEQINTEEATKNAFIMPFIQMLGYDVFNPMEVVPEMDCDLVKKKGEKIDYAIMKEGETIMLVECKHWKQDLSLHDTQLQRYFVASKARFGLLTNGIRYRFYTDLEKSNIMDSKPFLEVDLENLKESNIEELKKFHKSYFDIDNILSSASDLKYMSELKSCIKAEFSAPSPELVRLFTKRVYDGLVTPKVLEQFTELVKRSLANHINDVMAERLNVAIGSIEESQSEAAAKVEPVAEEPETPKFITTPYEIEGFYIVKAILHGVIESERVTYRDAQTYFAVFADDNNRKPICRLYFNSANKYIGIFDADKNETKHSIASLDEIYLHADELKQAVQKYL